MKYSPDVWAQVRGRADRHVFEVWHCEMASEATEDVLFSSLVRGISYLHIVCTGYNLTSNDAQKIVDLILYNTHNKKGELLLHPNSVYITELPTEIHDNNLAIRKSLEEELDFRL